VQTDRFTLEAVDLGKLFKVKIRHDDSNLSSDWYLDRVEVRDPDVGEPYVFHCERWLAKKKDDCKLERSLYVKVCMACHATCSLRQQSRNQGGSSFDGPLSYVQRSLYDTIRYDTIQQASLTCAGKLAEVCLIYGTEPQNKYHTTPV